MRLPLKWRPSLTLDWRKPCPPPCNSLMILALVFILEIESSSSVLAHRSKIKIENVFFLPFLFGTNTKIFHCDPPTVSDKSPVAPVTTQSPTPTAQPAARSEQKVEQTKKNDIMNPDAIIVDTPVAATPAPVSDYYSDSYA